MIFFIEVDQEGDGIFHTVAVYKGFFPVCGEKVVSELVVQTDDCGVKIVVEVVSGLDHVSVLIELCSVLSHFDKFVPVFGISSSVSPASAPELFVIVVHTGGKPVICIVDIAVHEMG